jgi:hypothetical protein
MRGENSEYWLEHGLHYTKKGLNLYTKGRATKVFDDRD